MREEVYRDHLESVRYSMFQGVSFNTFMESFVMQYKSCNKIPTAVSLLETVGGSLVTFM